MLYFINTVTNEKSIECGRRSPSGDREFRARRSPVGDGLPHSEVQFRPENVIVFMKPATKHSRTSSVVAPCYFLRDNRWVHSFLVETLLTPADFLRLRTM